MTGMSRVRRLCRSSWARLMAASLTAAAGVAVVYAIFSSSSPLVVLQHSVVHAVVTCGLAGLVIPRVAERLGGHRPLAGWAVVIPLLLGMSVVGTLLACAILAVLHVDGADALRSCFAADFRVNVVVTMALGVGLTLYERQRDRLEQMTLELRTRELESERAHKAALEARLASLESRVHPHFLFNTLNAISALIPEDPERAERTVERLAALLRFSLDAAAPGTVPLADELRIVADYLEIEKTRFGDRLAYVVDVEPALRHRTIPPLAIQTLVENSVKHAIAPRPGGGRIRVGASMAADRLVVTVWDDGPGFTPAAIANGHGVDNLQGRLRARYGTRATLEVSRHDNGTLVTLSLPATAG